MGGAGGKREQTACRIFDGRPFIGVCARKRLSLLVEYILTNRRQSDTYSFVLARQFFAESCSFRANDLFIPQADVLFLIYF